MLIKFWINKVSICYFVINEHKQLTVTMVSKEDISDMFKKKIGMLLSYPLLDVKLAKTPRNGLSSFNNNCKLNRIHGQDKMLMFKICLTGAAKCWYFTLSEQLKTNFESLTEQFTHDYLQNNPYVNTTRLENQNLHSI